MPPWRAVDSHRCTRAYPSQSLITPLENQEYDREDDASKPAPLSPYKFKIRKFLDILIFKKTFNLETLET